jgi:hypothetical protein
MARVARVMAMAKKRAMARRTAMVFFHPSIFDSYVNPVLSICFCFEQVGWVVQHGLLIHTKVGKSLVKVP